MNDHQIFDFDSHPVRVVEQEGRPWWVAADVGEALGLGDTRDAVSRLDDDEKGAATVDAPGAPRRWPSSANPASTGSR